MKPFIFILILLLTCSITKSQEAKSSPEGKYSSHESDNDSINYYFGVKYFKEKKNKFSKNKFLNVFVGKYSKWHDSTISFVNKNNKSDWLRGISEINLKGYNKEDSLFFIKGKALFENEEFENCRKYFMSNIGGYTYNYSIYYDSGYALTKKSIAIMDSLTRIKNFEKEKERRKWVYLGLYDNYNKYGEYLGPKSCYYDVNHLLFEADSVCIMTKNGDSDYYGDYRYLSLNLNTKVVHGIDNSFIYSGESYNYVWDGDWWKENSAFAMDLYNAIKKYIK